MSGDFRDGLTFIVQCKLLTETGRSGARLKQPDFVSYHRACIGNKTDGFIGVGWNKHYKKYLSQHHVNVPWLQTLNFATDKDFIHKYQQIAKDFERIASRQAKTHTWHGYLPLWITMPLGARIVLLAGQNNAVAIGYTHDKYDQSRLTAEVIAQPLPSLPHLSINEDHAFRPVRWQYTRSNDREALQAELKRLGLERVVSHPRPTTIRAVHPSRTRSITSATGLVRAKHLYDKKPFPSNLTVHESNLSPTHSQAILFRSVNIVLEGVPGTGKTHAIQTKICQDQGWPGVNTDGTRRSLAGKGREAYAITLHPATTYEDFVEGLRPSSGTVGEPHSANNPGPRAPGTARKVAYGDKPAKTNQRYFHIEQPDIHGSTGGTASFRMQDGFFLRVCAEATNNPDSDYVVLLDEINRCNVPKVMGDLLTTIERSKRAKWVEADGGYWDLSKCQVVTLPGSKRLFFVPENVYVVATMNTTDRSVAPLDAALRRRFAFVRLWPMGFGPSATVASAADAARVIWSAGGPTPSAPADPFLESVRAWWILNEGLQDKGPDAMLGHSYLFDLAEDMRDEPQAHEQRAAVLHHWNFHLLPQLIDVAVSNHLEADLVVKATDLGPLTAGLFAVDSDFQLEGSMPAGSGMLQVPTLTLVDNGSARGSER